MLPGERGGASTGVLLTPTQARLVPGLEMLSELNYSLPVTLFSALLYICLQAVGTVGLAGHVDRLDSPRDLTALTAADDNTPSQKAAQEFPDLIFLT